MPLYGWKVYYLEIPPALPDGWHVKELCHNPATYLLFTDKKKPVREFARLVKQLWSVVYAGRLTGTVCDAPDGGAIIGPPAVLSDSSAYIAMCSADRWEKTLEVDSWARVAEKMSPHPTGG